MNKLKEEPVITIAALVVLVEAAILMLIEFGLIDWTPTQQKYAMGFVVALLPILGALVSRYLVTPLYAPKDRDGTPFVRGVKSD